VLRTIYPAASKSDNDNEPGLLSYYVGADEVRLRFDNADHLRLKINNVNITTNEPYSELLDGSLHHVAVSWDNTNGDVMFYIDGTLVEHIDGLAVGHTIATGGELALGNDQDGPDTDYRIEQTLSGTLHDVRIWDEVRSEVEIASNYQSKIDTSSLPNALVANWQMDGFNGSNEIVDVVSGNNLSIEHATGTGFISSASVGDLHIGENASMGTSVGYILPSDPDTHQDLVEDGGFLKGDTGTWRDIAQGETFGDWTVESGTVSHTSQYPSPNGGLGLELQRIDGDYPSAITQTITTVAGQQYQLVFGMTGNFSGGEAIKHLTASAGGESMDFSVSQTASSGVVYEARSMTFTATSTNTVLRFAVGADDGYAAVISDVSVVEVSSDISTILNNDPSLSYNAATGKFYKAVSSSTDWDTAQSNAGSDLINGVAGNLATIRSETENEFLRDLLSENAINGAWIGASDSAVEGTWVWQDGSDDAFYTGAAATSGFYENFGALEPNGGASENHAELVAVNGDWNDLDGSASRSYIVEWSASEVLSSATFSLTDDAGGRFDIDSNTGEITVADGSLLDYEAATSHDIDVQTTDAAGNSYSETMTISIDNEIDASQTVPAPQHLAAPTLECA